MTTELTKAAQAALNACERIVDQEDSPVQFGIDFRALGSSLRRALTQRPAAQTEREAFEAWWKGDLVDWRGHASVSAGHAWAAWQARASLPAPQQATPEPDVDDKWRDAALRFDKHRMQALWHLKAMLQDPARHADIVRQFLKDPTHPAAATPEPVGEPAAWRWFNSNGDQVTNWLDFKASQKANVEAQVAEAGGRIEYAYARPAPGVPEVPQEWFHLLAEARNVAYDEEGYVMEPDLASAVEDIDAALAAAQAKGADK